VKKEEGRSAMPQNNNQSKTPQFAVGQAVWVKLPLEFGVEYEFVASVLRVLSNEPGRPIFYEVQGAVRERYTVQEEWLSTHRRASSSVIEGTVARLGRFNAEDLPHPRE
jgi:hypothetical protein